MVDRFLPKYFHDFPKVIVSSYGLMILTEHEGDSRNINRLS